LRVIEVQPEAAWTHARRHDGSRRVRRHQRPGVCRPPALL